MRAAALVLLLLSALVHADDRAFCSAKCGDRYADEPNLKTACETGCSKRGSIENGSRNFPLCYAACEAAFNETLHEEERGACDSACALPYTKVLVMKVDYGNGDSAPIVDVKSNEGVDLLTSGNADPFNLAGILRPSDVNGNLMLGGVAPSTLTMRGDGNGWKMPEGDLASMFDWKTGDRELDRIRMHMKEMVQQFFGQRMLGEDAAAGGGAHQHQQPQQRGAAGGGEGVFALQGGSKVGNEGEGGDNIIVVHPVNYQGNGADDGLFNVAFMTSETSMRRRHPMMVQQWTMCIILVVAIMCTAIVALLMLRHLRLHRYRALRAASAPTAAACVSHNAPPMPIKIPIDEEPSSLPEPTGVPPPAYDQLSVHSKHAPQ